MGKKIVYLFIICWCISALATVQFDIKNYIIDFETDTVGDNVLAKRVYNFDANTYAHIPVAQYLSVYFKERLEGSTVYMAQSERVIPFMQQFAAGLLLEKKTLFHFGITSDILGRASTIPSYYSTVAESTTITQRMLHSANIHWDVSERVFDVLLDLNYIRLNYDRIWEDGAVAKSIDDDLWSEADLGIIPGGKSITLGMGMLMKNNITNTDDFNYGDYYGDIAGDHTVDFIVRKLYLDWRLGGHYRLSQALADNGDADGPASVLYLRPVFEMKNDFYLKGVAKLDISADMQKQWYELMVRKAWKNNSSIDVRYWTVLGSYFPRQGTRATLAVYAGPIGFVPELQVFWRVNTDTGDFAFYRATASFETLVNINRIDIMGGYTYSYFKDLLDRTPYATRGTLYFGVRKW